MEDTNVRDEPATPPPPPPPPIAPRRLVRRAEEGKVGGVCAGIADYLGLDVTVVRIAAVLLAFAGPGIPAYLVSWAVMPVAPPGTPPNPVRHGPVFGDGNGAIAGVALLVFAALIAFDGGLFDRQVLLPGLLIGGGVWLLVRDQDAAGRAPAAGAAGGTAGAAGPATAGQASPASTALAPWQGPTGGGAGAGDVPRAAPGAAADGPPVPKRRSNRLGTAVLGLLALGAAAVWLLAAADVVDPDLGDVLALGLVGIGLGLLVGAWWGRARSLIFPGMVVVLALTAVTAIDVPLEGGAGERRYRPLEVADVRDEYRLGTGEMEIDLRALDLAGRRVPVEASVGAGELQVLVPEDATVELSGRITVGQLVLPGDSARDRDARGGLDVDEDVVLEGSGDGGTLVLDLQVGLGEVEVIRG